jgi:cytochrome P450
MRRYVFVLYQRHWKSILSHPSPIGNWVSVEIYEMLLHIVARISARVFVGESLARNDDWVQTSIKYAEQATVTTMILRAFPKGMHPFVVWFIPAFWSTKRWVKRGRQLLVPLINARLAAQQNDPSYQKHSDFLQWMMDGADANDGVPEKLAVRELIMGLASVHTTTMAAAHALYDLCERPEYFEPLREELRTVLQEDGGWQKLTVHKLRKMDSFLKESQRLNPASLCKKASTISI